MRAVVPVLVSLSIASSVSAQHIDPASAFGARQTIESISLSPDGTKIAYVAPGKGQASQLFTVDLNANGKTWVALTSSGKPDRLGQCGWISNTRLACSVYGDEWYQQNGFRSWKTAIGDVTDSGRWLVAQGIADPKKLAIFGWSYGGYAALQSGATAPDLFKAIIAIAPVTDLAQLRLDGVGYSNRRLLEDYIGSGPHLKEGSPAQNAGLISAPVLIVHGLNDVNVNINQSRLMVNRLKDAGRPPEYMEVPELDHYMEDSQTRREMLSRSSVFLAKALGR